MRIPGTLAILFVLGCATAQPRAGAPAVSRDAADHCAALGHEWVTLAPDASLETAVETVACGGRLARAPAAADRWYVRRHQQFDERTSSLEVATMILAFTQEGASHLVMDLESFGYIDSYAGELSLSRVEKELQSYPDEVSRPFRTRLQVALAKLKERAAGLRPRDRATFVDLLSRVRREHLAHAKALVGFEHETTALLHTVDQALGQESAREQLSRLTREAEQLRENILIRCTDRRPLQDCLDGPLLRPLSERLLRLAQAAGDIPRATAEREQLREGTDKSTLALHLAVELHRALSPKEGAVDGEEALTVMLPGETWAESSVPLTWGPTASFQDETGTAQPTATVRVHGVIKSYHSHAGGMEIVLEEGAPIVLPFGEARLLKYSEKLEAIVDRETRRGVVLYAHHYSSARIVQFRGTRLGGTRGVEMEAHLAVHP